MDILDSLGEPLPGQIDYSKAVPAWLHDLSDKNRRILDEQLRDFREITDDRSYFNTRLATIAVQAERP